MLGELDRNQNNTPTLELTELLKQVHVQSDATSSASPPPHGRESADLSSGTPIPIGPNGRSGSIPRPHSVNELLFDPPTASKVASIGDHHSSPFTPVSMVKGPSSQRATPLGGASTPPPLPADGTHSMGGSMTTPIPAFGPHGHGSPTNGNSITPSQSRDPLAQFNTWVQSQPQSGAVSRTGTPANTAATHSLSYAQAAPIGQVSAAGFPVRPSLTPPRALAGAIPLGGQLDPTATEFSPARTVPQNRQASHRLSESADHESSPFRPSGMFVPLSQGNSPGGLMHRATPPSTVDSGLHEHSSASRNRASDRDLHSLDPAVNLLALDHERISGDHGAILSDATPTSAARNSAGTPSSQPSTGFNVQSGHTSHHHTPQRWGATPADMMRGGGSPMQLTPQASPFRPQLVSHSSPMSGTGGNVSTRSPVPMVTFGVDTDIVGTARDQSGCRQLQRILQTYPWDSTEVQSLVDAVTPRIVELMADQYGNFLIQKLLEVAPNDARLRLTRTIAPSLAAIATTQHGTFAVQKLVESLRNAEEEAAVCEGLRTNMHALMCNQHGGHVVYKAVQSTRGAGLPTYVLEGLLLELPYIATDRHGCCVLQKLMEASTEEQFVQIVECLAPHAGQLARHPFGNYVVQKAQHVAAGNPKAASPSQQAGAVQPIEKPANQRVEDRLAGELAPLAENLAVNQYASKALELVIRYASSSIAVQVMHTLASDPAIMRRVSCDSYGNYFVQTCLLAGPIDGLEKFLDALASIMHVVKTVSSVARKVESRFEEGKARLAAAKAGMPPPQTRGRYPNQGGGNQNGGGHRRGGGGGGNNHHHHHSRGGTPNVNQHDAPSPLPARSGGMLPVDAM